MIYCQRGNISATAHPYCLGLKHALELLKRASMHMERLGSRQVAESRHIMVIEEGDEEHLHILAYFLETAVHIDIDYSAEPLE